MTIFRLKQIATHPLNAAAGVMRWNYDRAELIADGVVHAVGVLLGLIAATALVTLSGVFGSPSEIVAVSIYVAGLLAMLGLSAAYNLWPVSPRKWLLRRFDHSAIYAMIAATYTPFVTQFKDGLFAALMLVGVWGVAALGIVMKLVLPGRLDRVSVLFYLALGWSGFFAYDAVAATLPHSVLWLILTGGGLYTLGVIFHAWQRLRFQNAIWHCFVLLGAACHYTAVLDLVLA